MTAPTSAAKDPRAYTSSAQSAAAPTPIRPTAVLPATAPGTDPAPGPLEYPALPAEAAHITPVRRALARWAALAGMTAQEAADLAQAAYEAMANVVAHAYPGGQAGHLAVLAGRTPSAQILVVVRDHGRWKPPGYNNSAGGFGLRMIRALAHSTTVILDPSGATTVCMRWNLEPGLAPLILRPVAR